VTFVDAVGAGVGVGPGVGLAGAVGRTPTAFPDDAERQRQGARGALGALARPDARDAA
jgi:hypothetical protein